MVLKGVDEIDWLTDRPDRVEGTWKPQKRLTKGNKPFERSEPNAQTTPEAGERRKILTLVMLQSKT